MDILMQALEVIGYIVLFFVALIVFALLAIVTVAGDGSMARPPEGFWEKRRLMMDLTDEARMISTPQEREAFIRKLDKCRPKLDKKEKKEIIQYIGRRLLPPPRPNGRPVAVRPPIEMRVRIEDFGTRHNS